MYFLNILYNQKCQKINTRNYFREQDQENRIFATASKEYKRQKDFEKPRKNDRKRYNDGMWTTTERVDLEVGKTQKE